MTKTYRSMIWPEPDDPIPRHHRHLLCEVTKETWVRLMCLPRLHPFWDVKSTRVRTNGCTFERRRKTVVNGRTWNPVHRLVRGEGLPPSTHWHRPFLIRSPSLRRDPSPSGRKKDRRPDKTEYNNSKNRDHNQPHVTTGPFYSTQLPYDPQG